jgi:hypothetical protein
VRCRRRVLGSQRGKQGTRHPQSNLNETVLASGFRGNGGSCLLRAVQQRRNGRKPGGCRLQWVSGGRTLRRSGGRLNLFHDQGEGWAIKPKPSNDLRAVGAAIAHRLFWKLRSHP